MPFVLKNVLSVPSSSCAISTIALLSLFVLGIVAVKNVFSPEMISFISLGERLVISEYTSLLLLSSELALK